MPDSIPMSPQSAIAHYRIVSKLGEGGMGAVYRATDTKLNRDVAIKVLPEAFAQDADRLARFTREAHVLASLNHPNIAAIHGVEERALVMELVEGETLKGPVPLDRCLDYARQIADALEYAHERGVVHRDLKPANIKVTPEGVVKLLDFGLAKAMVADSPQGDPAVSPTLTMNATMAGVILGTAAYMSPEQAKGMPADRRADIWAFGVVLYELLVGRELFAGETVSDTLAHVLTREPDWTLAPAPVRRLLRTCLQKDPKQRLRSIGDWRLLLDEPAAPPSTAGGSRRVWVATAVAVVFAVAAAWGWFGRREPEAASAYHLSVQPPDGESLYQDTPSGFQAISPDGRTLAFIAGANGARRIWIRPLDSPTARSLAGTELADGLFWSPDSQHLGFTAGNKLHRANLSTGAVREICDSGSSLRGATWNKEGVIVFGSTATPLRRVSAEGGVPVAVTAYNPQTDIQHNFPQFLPDGRRFLYWVRGSQPAASGVYSGSLDILPEKQAHQQILASPTNALYVSSSHEAAGHLLFQRGRTLFAQPFDTAQMALTGKPRAIAENVGARSALGEFSVSGSGVLATSPAGGLFRTVTLMSRKGEVISTVGKPDAYTALRLSPDGKSVALVRTDAGSSLHIWLMDIANGTPVRFTDTGGMNVYPTWSPDGKELIFSSNRGEGYQLYRKAIGGQEQILQEQIGKTGDEALAKQWLTNPPRLLYLSYSWEKVGAIMRGVSAIVLPLVPGGKPVSLGERSGAAHFSVSVSPSGRWFAYMSDESGTEDVYVRPMPVTAGEPLGPAVRISSTGGADPLWSADGKELFFNTPDGRLMSSKLKFDRDRLEREEPSVLFPLGGTSVFNGALFWQPIGNGERFLVLRSTPVSNRDNTIQVMINWQKTLQ